MPALYSEPEYLILFWWYFRVGVRVKQETILKNVPVNENILLIESFLLDLIFVLTVIRILWRFKIF